MPTSKKRFFRNHPNRRNGIRRKNYTSTAGPELNRNHGKIWTAIELEVLEKWIYTDRELHIFLGRSVQAIQCKRCELRKRR